jgi:hypothetical protein
MRIPSSYSSLTSLTTSKHYGCKTGADWRFLPPIRITWPYKGGASYSFREALPTHRTWGAKKDLSYITSEMWFLRRGDAHCVLLCCDPLQSCRWLPKSWRNMPPTSFHLETTRRHKHKTTTDDITRGFTTRSTILHLITLGWLNKWEWNGRDVQYKEENKNYIQHFGRKLRRKETTSLTNVDGG